MQISMLSIQNGFTMTKSNRQPWLWQHPKPLSGFLDLAQDAFNQMTYTGNNYYPIRRA